MDNKSIGLFLIGIALGMLLPTLPAIGDINVSPYLPFVFIAIAIVLLVKG